MPNKSKQKGNQLEREVVKSFQEAGYDAMRAYGSNGEAMGQHKDVDVLVAGDDVVDELKVQCKRRAKLCKDYKPSDAVDCVIYREDHDKTSYILMKLDTFIKRYY